MQSAAKSLFSVTRLFLSPVIFLNKAIDLIHIYITAADGFTSHDF